jgi:MFS transporter, DHA1 family, multidrug resistance protein
MAILFKINSRSSIVWKRTIYIMFFAQMVSMIGFSSVFPFLPLYVKALGTTTTVSTDIYAGLAYSGQAFTMMIASPIWGFLADRWGRKAMVVRSMLGGSITLAMMAFVHSAEELVLLRMVQGIVTGVMGATNALVAAAVPRSYAGYAMGLMQVAIGLGLGLGPVIGGFVADAYGYQAAFFVTGTLLAMAGFVVLFGVEEQLVSKPATRKNLLGFFNAWRQIVAMQQLRFIYSLRFLNQAGRMVFIPILPLFIMSLLDSPERVNGYTGLVIGCASAATAIFSILFGRLGDRRGHYQIVIFCLLLSSLSFAIQGFVTVGWQLLWLQILYGTALGGTVTGISALLANATEEGDEGFVYGLDNSVNSGARVVGPMLGVTVSGWLGIRMVFGAAAILYLLAGGLAIWGMALRKLQGKFSP